jgi:hypothetical protein
VAVELVPPRAPATGSGAPPLRSGFDHRTVAGAVGIVSGLLWYLLDDFVAESLQFVA